MLAQLHARELGEYTEGREIGKTQSCKNQLCDETGSQNYMKTAFKNNVSVLEGLSHIFKETVSIFPPGNDFSQPDNDNFCPSPQSALTSAFSTVPL